MAENIRKRTSKWDVVPETYPTETGQHNPLTVKADDSSKDKESKQDMVSETRSTEVEVENTLSVIADDSFKDKESKADCNPSLFKVADMERDKNLLDRDSYIPDQSFKWSHLGDDNMDISKDSSGTLHFPILSTMDAGDLNFSKKPSWETDSGNQTAANVPQSSVQPHAQVADKDCCKMSTWESASGNEITVEEARSNKETDGCGAALDSYTKTTSPGFNERKRQSQSISPRSRSRSYRSRSRSRSSSRSRSRSRSHSRSQNRSWSRSPSYALKHGSERWADRGRTVRRSAVPCRAFALGRCVSGSQCRYLHEGQKDFDSGTTGQRDFRSERGRYSGHDNKETFSNSSWEQRDYSRDGPRERNGSQHDGWERPGVHRNNSSSQPCFDFTKGRCYRGSSCRYIHDDAPSDGVRSMKDEPMEKTQDRRDGDAPFGKRLEPHRISDIPCKYFPEGRCRKGEKCKFSHQDVSYGHPDGRQYDSKKDNRIEANYRSSITGSNRSDQSNTRDTINSSSWVTDARAGSDHSMVREDTELKAQYPLFVNPKENEFQKPMNSQQENVTQEASEKYSHVPTVASPSIVENPLIQQQTSMKTNMPSHEGGNISANNSSSQAPITYANNLLTVPSGPGQNFVQSGQSQYVVPQPLYAQNVTPNVQIQQVPPLSFNGQMQPVFSRPPSGQNQYTVPQAMPNAQNFSFSMPSQPVLGFPAPSHNGQNQQNFNFRGPVQQNLPGPHNGLNQQNFSYGGQIQTIPHNAQSQANPHLFGQVQHSLVYAGAAGQNQQNINITGQGNSNILPQSQTGQGQLVVQSVAPNAQNPYGASQSLVTQSFNTGEQGQQVISQHQPNNRHHTKTGGEVSTELSVEADGKPLPSGTNTQIPHKVVTSEQAAKITNLSASLAQFFGSGQQLPQLHGTLKPQSATGLSPSQPLFSPASVRPLAPHPQQFLQSTQGSWKQQQAVHVSASTEPSDSDTSNVPPGFSSVAVVIKDPKVEESQASIKSPVPLSATGDNKDANQRSHDKEQAKLNNDNASKEQDDTETGQSKKEQTSHQEDVRTDGESKRSKDAKGNRLFKAALVEFVKDTLKPAWKEGHLSKEVHKTIVKKVVDKVTGAMLASNIPQTQEKIDAYMAYSKPKLNKLVQAYLEKYV